MEHTRAYRRGARGVDMEGVPHPGVTNPGVPVALFTFTLAIQVHPPVHA